MKLNPKKLHLWSTIREVTQFYHKSSRDQIQSVVDRSNNLDGPPQSTKDIQKLAGSIAALHEFISRLGERGLLFFKLLKKIEKFKWNDD